MHPQIQCPNFCSVVIVMHTVLSTNSHFTQSLILVMPYNIDVSCCMGVANVSRFCGCKYKIVRRMQFRCTCDRVCEKGPLEQYF
jgi:hypothetical protein